ncbi:MAG: glycosyl hydrolase family 28-related protein, partial [Pseudomonadota bacterium]
MPEHIKMPDVAPIARLVSDGSQTIFTYPFPIFASEDMAVYLDGAKQSSGYDLSGVGKTNGGTVTFDTAPASGVVITLARELPIERTTDYLEGGDFSAASINAELDYLIAALQQVNRENDVMLKYSDHETPGETVLPSRENRKNMALGFDGNGDPIPMSMVGSMAAPDFTASGIGAGTRTSNDKFSDLISIKDFGAVGDGLTDDTTAIQNALAAHDMVLIPNGEFLISSTINLISSQSIIGLGQKSILKMNNNSFVAVQLSEKNITLQNFRIEGGSVGIKLFGNTDECTQNSISDIQIIGAATGIQLDGHDDTAEPTYWNNFARILIEQPTLHGVHLTNSGAGDTPNANSFHNVRVYSKGANTTGSGFYVEHGSHANSFIDCEANVNGAKADSCFRIGAASNKTLLINIYTESTNLVPNLKLDSGSTETAIMNLHAQSDGAAILDNSGGEYDAINAGFPEKNTLRKTVVTDLKATLSRHDTEFIDVAGTTALDLSHSVHIVDATNGAITIELPNAGDAIGVEMVIKKADATGNIITITEDSGNGPDGNSLQLGGPNDYAIMLSNGAEWFITASNRLAGNTRFHDGAGTYDIDMAVDTYL